jgi:hypothetical protein
MANLADGSIHLAAREFHDGREALILKRNSFDAVDAEEGQLPDVSFKLCGIPGIV